MKCNQSRPGFELVSPRPIPMTITITPRAEEVDKNKKMEEDVQNEKRNENKY